jgi:hypothetical protein
MRHTKRRKLIKRTKRTKRNKLIKRRRQRGGDGAASWTPQTDRIGDPDAVGQVTSLEKYEEHTQNEPTDSY